MVQSEIEERTDREKATYRFEIPTQIITPPLTDDYSGFNETNFSMRTAKLPAHEAAGGGRGSGTDDYGVHRFLSCSCLSYSKELWETDAERMSTPPGFKDPVFISLKLSSVSFWNKDLMSLQDGGDGDLFILNFLDERSQRVKVPTTQSRVLSAVLKRLST
ncbi:hypothetical protein G5I_14298 [Acromyrmex echinatior]|uniref:Uncharacterized protein n=1 Tax=Acromyrmex echinatior TaxID=103372 RepID=F4X708_ACREC|nr:hypothetical protein G5I_14298 [Acromyrmex echinatior]